MRCAGTAEALETTGPHAAAVGTAFGCFFTGASCYVFHRAARLGTGIVVGCCQLATPTAGTSTVGADTHTATLHMLYTHVYTHEDCVYTL